MTFLNVILISEVREKRSRMS